MTRGLLSIVLLPCLLSAAPGAAIAMSEPPAAGEERGEGNRLRLESSPYLLQHAWNPVDWWPWSPEAIAEARRRDVPILLSIGYSTCYWCHVMERESFEDPKIAEILNRDFLPIKVDREQRPDVDDIYMTACQVYTQMTEGRASGGWPLNAFLDPNTLEPFVVGTYFPPEPMPGRPSFGGMLESIATAWRDQRPALEAQAERIAGIVRDQLRAGRDPRPLPEDLGEAAVVGLLRYHDPAEGGFGAAPKFPQPVFLEILLELGWDRPEVREAVARTLDRMAAGGIQDQVAGGFHRYAVDGTWTVPHFEKMLYDNGQLASVYAESVERTGDRDHARVLRRLLAYVEREMTEPDGCFRSAQDAEVDAREGGTHVWRPEEIAEALRTRGLADDVDFALEIYGLDQGPNFRDPHHQDDPPSNVLRLDDRTDVIAKAGDVSAEDLRSRLDRVNAALLDARDLRPQPALDDKVLASWNGLMIRGFADAGRALEKPRYLEVAGRAADAVLARLGGASDLRRTARGVVLGGPAFLDDYALLADGLLTLHRATDDPVRLEQAAGLVAAAREHFRDPATGLWYDTRADQSDLLVRACNLNDGATPSGAGTMMLVLAGLAERTGEMRYLDDLEAFLAAASGPLVENAVGPIRATLARRRLGQLDPERSARLARSAADVEAPTIARDGVGASLEVVDPGAGSAIIRLSIRDGWHVNAHDPGEGEAASLMVGLTLDVVSGGEVDVQWPVGELWEDGILVHKGEVEIPIVVRPESPGGSVVVSLGWQACDDRVCFQPRRVELVIETGSNP